LSDVVSDRITVEATPEAVWDVIADFEAYPQWQPDVKEAEILEYTDDGWGERVRFVVDAKLFVARLVLAYTYTDTTMRWVLVEGDTVRKNDGMYTVEPLDETTTEVTYELEIAPAVPIPGVMRRTAARRIVGAALSDMKQRVEAGS
jgi:ribosome-associated toxin RatA of RatAB toxin-antitoxin module